MFKEELIAAAIAHFNSQAFSARVNLNVYLNNPVGVGEHPDHLAEVVSLTKKIAEAEECILLLKEMTEDP